MKKSLRISLSITIPLILNIGFIVFIVMKDSICEQKVFRHDIETQNFYLYLIWIVLQIITVGLVFIKLKYRKQITALPIITLLFVGLFANWTLDLKKMDNYDKFDKEMWMNSNIYFRINYVEDIVSNNKLKDKCYDEIIDMLGKPNVKNKNRIEYKLGFGIMIIRLQDNCFDEIEIKCK